MEELQLNSTWSMKIKRHTLKLTLAPGVIMHLLLDKSNLAQNLINMRGFPWVCFIYVWSLFLLSI